MRYLSIALLVAHYTAYHPLATGWLILNWAVLLAGDLASQGSDMQIKKILEDLTATVKSVGNEGR